MSQQSSKNNDNNDKDFSTRDISKNPINYAIDSTEDEFRPSKFSRLVQFVIDELKRNYNIDPTGESFFLAICTSANKGQSYRIIADSTENQKHRGEDLWSAVMVQKEVAAMKLGENEKKLIEKARSQNNYDNSISSPEK